MRGQNSFEYILTVGGILVAAVLIGSFLIDAASNIYNSVTGVSGATLEVTPNPGKLAYWESTDKLGAASFLTVGSNVLTVSGRLVVSEICLAGSCITTWPSGGSSTDTRCDTAGTCSQLCIGSDCISSWSEVNTTTTGGGTTIPENLDVNSVDANYLCLNGDCIGSWNEVNQTTTTGATVTYSWSVAPYDKIDTGICTIYNGTKYCELKASLCMELCGESGLTSNCIDAGELSCDDVIWPVLAEDISEVPVSDSDGDGIGEIQSSGTITIDFQGAETGKGWSYSNLLMNCNTGSTLPGSATIGPNGIEFKTGAYPYYCLRGTAEYNIWVGRTITVTICATHGYNSGVDGCAFHMFVDGTVLAGYSSVWCRSSDTECGTVALTPGYHQIKIDMLVDDSSVYENTAAYLSKVTISGLSGEIIYSKTYNEMYEIK